MSGLSSTLELPCGACDGLITAPGFSPHQVCPLCSESICSDCWGQGTRACKEHTLSATIDQQADRTVWRGLARSYETFFIDAFISQLAHIGHVSHPRTGKKLAVDPSIFPIETDESIQLDRILDRSRDRSALEVRGCPTCRRLTFPIKKSALFGFSSTTELVLVAACIARLERYVDPGFDSDPISMEQLARHIERWALDPDVMHCVGVLSPTGWIGDTPQELSTGTREVVLVEPACSAGLTDQQGFAFRTHRHPTLDPRVSAIFDPESAEAKVARAIGFLEQHPTLQAPGGLLMLDEELEKLHIERSQLAEAVAQMVDEEEDKLISEHLAGEWILRRRRN